ncbi:hypothetical protein D9Q98_003668 [Chlorella vulgaris]|uniref:Endonuclease/exonuclease/phosphatase domain-containing protein n=1 Tax=Chlorella vulgaris TaxID=3077 RepID=A0A9D4YZN0_CHLVU|nr:hypothetical protein D9Q98_003668 [Chlorella vulgaris]
MGAAVVGLALTCLRRRAAVRCGHGRHRVRIVPRSKPLHSMPDEISLVSYNVLCQRYANSRRFPHVYAQYLEASYRLERIKQELAAFGADIIALQEVTIDSWPELREFMAARGYAAVVQMRAAASGNDFMLALFYRSSKLQLAWTEERSRALLVALQVTAAGPAHGQMLWLANVHLEASPYRPNDRVSQLRSALQRLESHIGSSEAAEASDVIICGDFNSLEQDSPCWLLRQGRLERNHTDACCPQVPTTKVSIAHPFALHEAYDAAGYHLPFTHKVGQQHAVLDYVWSSRHMRVAAVMRPLQQEHRAMVDSSFLPNRVHPSDHLPIGAVLKLTCTAGVEEELQAAVAAAAPATKVAVAQAAAAEQRGVWLEPEGQGRSRGAANGDVHAVR